MGIERAYAKATSVAQFYELLQKEEGLELYFRGEKPGIQGEKRRYRLKTLGYSLERIKILSLQRNIRTQELNRIVSQRLFEKQQDNELEQ